MRVIVRQTGGLGNQMFQYAAGMYYAKKLRADLFISSEAARYAVSGGFMRPFLLSELSITAPVAQRTLLHDLLYRAARVAPIHSLLRSTLGVEILNEAPGERYRFVPNPPVHLPARLVVLDGYWQTFRLVDEVCDSLRMEFAFRKPPSGRNLELSRLISQVPNSVSVHIRRGDYLVASCQMVPLQRAYYEDAIRIAAQRLTAPTYFVFSDDARSARQYIPSTVPAIFIEHNDQAHAHEDLRLMSACNHHIIANSTLSWWGAWLNPRLDKIVIAPDRWGTTPGQFYPDLLPPDWIIVPARAEGYERSQSLHPSDAEYLSV